MPETLQDFAQEKEISAGVVFMLGGVDDESRLVVGPEDGTAHPVNPMSVVLSGAHEAAAVGMIFPDGDGTPILHMHAACGRGRSTTTGCIRKGIVTWHVLEVVLIELTDINAARIEDPETGFALLEMG
jgi:predicted DNA-binding protein with PD1-like motif